MSEEQPKREINVKAQSFQLGPRRGEYINQMSSKQSTAHIVEVWENNFEEEITKIMELTD